VRNLYTISLLQADNALVKPLFFEGAAISFRGFLWTLN